MDDRISWTCPACKRAVVTPYCARCGEEPQAARDLTLAGVLERLVHAVTSVDARTVRTAWRLVRHPGTLTTSWIDGARRPYVAPFQLFLIANVLFVAAEW